MRRRLSLLLVLAAACGGGTPDPRPASSSEPVDAAPAAADDALVVLALGEQPRHDLRYRVPVGTTRATEFKVEMAMEADGVRVIAPALTLVGSVEVTDVSAVGDTSLLWTFADAAVDGDGADPALVQGMQEAAATMVKTTFASVFTDRGATWQSDEIAAPSVDQVIENLSNSTSAMVVGLPDEPVGRGARWVVRSQQGRGGILFDISSEIEVIDVSATTLHVRTRSVYAAPLAERTTPMGTLPTEGTGRGRSEMTIDLTTLEADAVTEIEMSVQFHLADRAPARLDAAFRTRQRVR